MIPYSLNLNHLNFCLDRKLHCSKDSLSLCRPFLHNNLILTHCHILDINFHHSKHEYVYHIVCLLLKKPICSLFIDVCGKNIDNARGMVNISDMLYRTTLFFNHEFSYRRSTGCDDLSYIGLFYFGIYSSD